jgi:4-amino-4-deoxy-L-arabinose transferase-like glycosyltransferase
MTPSRTAPVAATNFKSMERRERLLLGGILALALALRVAWSLRMGTIDTEGAEYARIAENLLAGNGYSGIETQGKNLIFPPFFPLLIAAASALVGQAEWGGRLVSIVMGTLLVLPVYAIARQLYGSRVAPVAGFLIALHPMLAGFAASVYCESTYMALLMTAAYLSLQVFHAPTPRALLLAGATFGVAYLVRPEAALYSLLVSGIVVGLHLARGSSLTLAAKHALCLLAAFAVFALPYVLWLHAHSGQWRLEGKSPLNYATQLKMEQGIDPYDASFGVATDLSEQGVWMRPHATALQSVKMAPKDIVRYLARRVGSVSGFLKNTLVAGGMLGSPLIFALALIGLFSKPWPRELAIAQLFFFCILAISSTALFFIFYLSPRFLITFIPFLSLWAAAGIVALRDWLATTLELAMPKRGLRWLPTGFGLLLLIAVPLGTLQGVASLYELRMFNASNRPVKIAAQWLDHYAPGPKIVTDSLDVFPFHARATFVPLPYADSSTALRYLEKRQVRFIVLRDADKTSTPYLESWLKQGVPADGAKLIYNESSPALGRILIYEWKPRPSTS